ncbi:MAG: hypothetical protein EHM93_05145 [Bacteroidales bacterium]|nr:MAG: hypothetical protein EHM93_05145 [Bacteroidales bacterium]
MITSFTYKAFGLIIRSEVECPELIASSGAADVTIILGKTPQTLSNPIFSGVRFQTNGHEFLLAVDGIARYYAENGNSITIDVFPNADISDVRLFLLGSAMGAIIHQRGLLPFHGSSVKIGNTAIILSGVSGAGKSTLAAAFQQKGYHILSDDVSVVSFSSEGLPIVFPGFPQMKLWADSILKLGENPSNYTRTRNRLEKHNVPINSSFWDQPLPLKQIYIIVSSNLGVLKIEPIKGIEKFSMLKTHTYRFNFVAGKQMQATHFKTFDSLAKSIDVFRLTRPNGKFILNDLINLILGSNG